MLRPSAYNFLLGSCSESSDECDASDESEPSGTASVASFIPRFTSLVGEIPPLPASLESLPGVIEFSIYVTIFESETAI